MSQHLVIVESPAKAKSINKILGKDYIVRASMGHIRDLPRKKIGVDLEHGFKPEYVNIKGRQKTLKELEAAAKKADSVYLAPDPDREGEAIAWHLFEVLKNQVPEDQFYRVTYNEITPTAIKEAFSHPGRIDTNRVDSQQARRILDRIVGYRVSPLLWRRIRGASSAGRVQSVALRLICEREREIDDFTALEYWLLGASVRKFIDPKDPFDVRLTKVDGKKAEIGDTASAEEIQSLLKETKLTVTSLQEKTTRKRARPPFITSTLQQSASSALGFTPSRTMRLAQSLYEGMDFGEGETGLITYMRTDSVNLSKQSVEECRAYIEEKLGKEYVPEKPNFYKSKSSAQEAHEAIRPTSVTRTPASMKSHLPPDEWKLYKLIWERFVACQTAPAQIAQKLAEMESQHEASGRVFTFRASASEVVFDGYMRVTGQEKKKEDDQNDEEGKAQDKLPPLEEGEKLELLDISAEQKFTKPPPRFSEASLVKAMEEHGVGRPSTYASIISTLYDREYMEREKRQLKPTDTGIKVNDFLTDHLNALFDLNFTAHMEEELDDIERGKVEWTDMLQRFYEKFQEWVKGAKGPDADPETAKALLKEADQITEWAPPVKRGKSTYSDEKFISSLAKQLEEKKQISERQLTGVKRVLCRYKEQLPDFERLLKEYDLKAVLEDVEKASEPPRESSQAKLDDLKAVTFDEPRKVGKRTYDDKVFCESLRQQVEEGRRLSVNQLKYLDQLVLKYSKQIPDSEQKLKDWEVDVPEPENAETIEALLQAMQQVKEWNEPVKRGKRTWDDKEFFESLNSQYRAKKTLSPKQVSSLKRMAGKYKKQIDLPNLDELTAKK